MYDWNMIFFFLREMFLFLREMYDWDRITKAQMDEAAVADDHREIK